MLAGFGGRLVSEDFLESELAALAAPQAVNDLRERLERWRASCRSLGPASSIRTLFEAAAAPLAAAIGFAASSRLALAGDCASATLETAGGARLALLVTAWGVGLDPFWRRAVVDALDRGARWAFLFNGIQLRLVDAGRTYARRHVEFDLEISCRTEKTLAALWCLAHASAFEPGAAGDARLSVVVARSDRHAAAVSRSLRDGVLAASASLLGALVRRNKLHADPDGLAPAFEQSLTIVYRILFLLFAEARGLVPMWHPVYRESYSVDALRAAAEQPGAVGLWEALGAITRLAHAGCRAGDLRVTPFNGRLFAPHRTPLADRRGLDEEAARQALLALSTRPGPAGRQPIAYGELGVEQLGAVYETLLEYTPRIEPLPTAGAPPARARPGCPPVVLVRGSGARKTTGSFYTPPPIAEYLVRRALAPLVRDAAPDEILALRVVDPAAGSGAFLVAACRYLAEAYEQALVRAGVCRAGDLDHRDRAAARRLVAERCLYGVDLNPMAVQLARLSLWLATLAADRPLTFLDHHLRTGDSLAGAWLVQLRGSPRRRPAGAAGTGPLFPIFEAAGDALRAAVPIRFQLAMQADTIEAVRAKERALRALEARDSALTRWKRIADAWCAPWFRGSRDEAVPPSAFTALADAILAGSGPLPAHAADLLLARAEAIAQARRLFHWELEFPEVFFDERGVRRRDAGFDAVIGNPPWDMLRADQAPPGRHPHAGSRDAALVRFARESGAYTAQSGGHANRYQLFLERAITLMRPGGRLGMVLPGGLLTDHGSARLRRRLLGECDVEALVGFENRRGVFPIHRSVRFVLITASRGGPSRAIACRLGEHDPAALEAIGEEAADRSPAFPVRLAPALLERVSGESLQIPDIRSPLDLAILERAAALFPPLGSDRGWRARFGRELNATDHRPHLRAAGAGLPVVEGKHIHPFRVDVGAVRLRIEPGAAARLLGRERWGRDRLAYRDVAASTNRLTLVAALLPRGAVSTHTVFCLRTPLPAHDQHFLCGLFNSFVVNYLVRLRVTTHVTTSVVEQLPIPPRDHRPRARREIAAAARLLARRDDDRIFAGLQARVAALYQLREKEFARVLETFPLVAADTRRAALEAFRARAG